MSPHFPSNRLLIKSFLMGSKKSHAGFVDRFAGEAATTVVSTLTLLRKYRFVPKTRGSAKTRAARDFLKAIGAVLDLGCFEKKDTEWLLYLFSGRFRLHTRSLQTAVKHIRTPWHSSIQNSGCWVR